jgi:hypothetical protein
MPLWRDLEGFGLRPLASDDLVIVSTSGQILPIRLMQGGFSAGGD